MELLLLLHLRSSHKPHLRGMACEARRAPRIGRGAGPETTDRHPVCHRRSRQGKWIDIGIRARRTKPGVAPQRRRRKTPSATRLGMAGVMLLRRLRLLLLLLQMGLLQVRVWAVQARRPVAANRRWHIVFN